MSNNNKRKNKSKSNNNSSRLPMIVVSLVIVVACFIAGMSIAYATMSEPIDSSEPTVQELLNRMRQ